MKPCSNPASMSVLVAELQLHAERVGEVCVTKCIGINILYIVFCPRMLADFIFCNRKSA
jgi:hypothetical protein